MFALVFLNAFVYQYNYLATCDFDARHSQSHIVIILTVLGSSKNAWYHDQEECVHIDVINAHAHYTLYKEKPNGYIGKTKQD